MLDARQPVHVWSVARFLHECLIVRTTQFVLRRANTPEGWFTEICAVGFHCRTSPHPSTCRHPLHLSVRYMSVYLCALHTGRRQLFRLCSMIHNLVAVRTVYLHTKRERTGQSRPLPTKLFNQSSNIQKSDPSSISFMTSSFWPLVSPTPV